MEKAKKVKAIVKDSYAKIAGSQCSCCGGNNEAYRVLKPGGKMYVSDIVLLEELSDELRNNEEFIAGCVGGAVLKDEYIEEAKRAGFNIKIIGEDKGISKRQYQGIALESISIEALKKN